MFLKDEIPVTVILTTFKRPQLLKRAIKSVLDQTYPHFVLHIYDDASRDGTKEVATSFLSQDSRVYYHSHPKNLGMMANYVYAFSKVSTPFFCFFSDDDYLLPCYLERAMDSLKQFPEAAFFIGSTHFQKEDGKVLRASLAKWKKEGFLSSYDLIAEMTLDFPPPTNVFLRKEILSFAQIDLSNQIVWDCDFFLQIAARFPAVVSHEVLGCFCSHSSSFTAEQSLGNWEEGFHKIIQHFDLLPDLSTEIREKVRLNLTKYWEELLIDLVKAGYSVPANYLLNKQFKKAYLWSQKIDREFGKTSLRVKNAIIMFLAKACDALPFLFPFVKLLYKTKRLFRTLRTDSS